MARCTECGGDAGFMASMCDPCMAAARARMAREATTRVEVGAAADQAAELARERRRAPGFAAEASKVVLTTEGVIPAREIVEIVEIVTAQTVLGINIFQDLLAGMNDVFGGRAEGTENLLRQARQTCLGELREEAAALGADAVVGVRLDYSEIGGQNRNMLLLAASGTAVKTAPRAAG